MYNMQHNNIVIWKVYEKTIKKLNSMPRASFRVQQIIKLFTKLYNA
jgi:hypothetical protein